MLGQTIELNIGTIADPVLITLKKIDGSAPYTGEYRLKESDREHVVLIRHAKEKNTVKGKAVERHNVTYTVTLFPTELAPQGQIIQSSSVIRSSPEQANSEVLSVGNAVALFTSENIQDLVDWQS